MKKRIENFTFWIIAFIFCSAVIIVYKTFDNFDSVITAFGKLISALSPFIIAFVIAYILNLPIRKISSILDKCRFKFLSRHSLGISIIVSYIGAVGVIALVLGAVIPALYENVYDFYSNSGTYIENFKNFIKDIEILQKLDIVRSFEQFNISGSLVSLMSKIDGSSVQKYAEGVASATSGIVNFVVALIASVYMIIEKDTIISCCKRGVRAFVKEAWVDDIFSYCHRVNDVFTSYIYSRILVCLAMGCICSVVLSLMKVRYAFALGMFIGACDIIPYFGSIFATFIALFINLLSGGVLGTVWLAVVLIILQQIDGNILAPKIMGHKLEISPLFTVVTVVVGGKLFGFAGMVFSVPIAAIAKNIVGDLLTAVEKKRKSKEDAAS